MKQHDIRFILVAFLCFLSAPQLTYSKDTNLTKADRLNQEIVRLFQQGRYQEAISIAEEALAITKKAYGPEHQNVAACLNNLAASYYYLGNYSKAESHYKQSLAITKKANGPEHPDVAQCLNNLALLYESLGDYSKAESHYKQSLAITKKVYGQGHPKVARSLNNLAAMYYYSGDYSKTKSFYKQSLAITKKALGPEHPEAARILNELAAVYKFLGDYSKAEPLFQQSLAIRKKALGPEHPDVATCLGNLAELYRSLGDYSKAEPLFQQSLGIIKKVYGPEHPKVALSLNNLALLYDSLGDYTKAESLYKQSLTITQKAFGLEHPDVVTYMNNLASLYKFLGDYSKAESLFQKSLSITKKALGPEHPDVATCLGNLAKFYISLGDYTKAEPLFQQSLAIVKKVYGPEHQEVANYLISLAGLYSSLGDYSKAESLYKQSLVIWKNTFDPEHPKIGLIMNDLAVLYISLGDYSKAEPLFQQSLTIAKKTNGMESPIVAQGLFNLAELYRALGNYTKAESLFQQSITIREKALGPKHPDVAQSINGLALLYYSLGDYSKAEPLYQQSLAIRKKAFDPEHPDVAQSLNNLAALYYSLGDYSKAELLYKQSLAIREKALISELPAVADCLENLAALYAALNRFKGAHELFKRSQKIDDKLIDQVMGFTSEEQKMKFLSTKQRILFAFLSLVNQHLSKSPSARIDGLNVWLKRKGIILESQKRFQETLINSDDPLVVQIFQELSRVRARLSRLTFSGPGKKGMDAYKNEITLLKKQKEELEARLAKLSQKFTVRQEASKADCTKVARKLPANTVLIEFALISRFNFKAKGKEQKWMPDRYLAFVLNAGNGEMVDWVDLGPADKIDNSITNFKKEIIVLNEDHALMINASSIKLYTLIFEPLKKSIGGAKELFLSPDGNLNLVPFEVLQTPEGRYLIEDYTFNYLAAGRDILGFGQIKEKGTKALIIGDPDFNMDSEQEASILKTINLAQKKDGNTTQRSAGMRGLFFERLPETKEEVEKIGTLFDKENVNIYTGREAVEEVLKQKRTPKILHLATHGFFLSDLDLSTLSDERGLKIVPDYTRPIEKKINIENPLLRSGIALAGANNSLKFSNMDKNDGIVTAEKILGLRLRGTDMVVLSACETGLGEVKAGEGVYGLRRAFTQAGSRSIVMSMWSVPDRETKELMVEFYKNIQSGKMNRCQALRKAALKEKKVVRERYGHTNPLFWGAFVFMGEP